MDEIEEWAAARARVVELVGAEGADTERHVPACPDWTARDLLSHMVGLGADVLAGDEPDDHNPGWTQRQVDERRDRSVADLLEEWDAVASPLCDWMREHGARPLGDVVIHEQDLRGALDVPGGQDSAGAAAIRDRMAGRFAAGLEGRSLGPIALVGDDWQWCSSGETEQAAVLLRAGTHDLGRALVSRRSARQLRAWTERGDVEPYLPAFEVLGPLPDDDLSE